MIQTLAHTIYTIINSKKFFVVVIALLALQGIWMALSIQYPMAFDESYHFGIIQIYSHQWLPFITQQPANSGGFGDLTRYDSYLFHYLMSFPLRLISLFTDKEVVQILFLRVVNVGIFIAGLFAFRRLLRRFPISEGLINFSLLMLVLVPVVPFLAATINYDNLVFLLVPIFTSFALTCSRAISRYNKLPITALVDLLCVGMLGSLVKYAFVPIFAAGFLYVFFLLLRTKKVRVILRSLKSSFVVLRPRLKIFIVIIFVVSSGLFIERYGVNLVKYHDFEPDCTSVRSLSDCLQYGPWTRNYYLDQGVKATHPPRDPSIPLYLPTWIGTSVYKLYFAINYDFSTYAPLPIPIMMASIIGGLGLLLCVIFWRTIRKLDRHFIMIALIILFYLGGLFYVNFTEYLRYHTVVAVNGRYLIIILPFLFVLIGLAYRRFIHILLKARTQTFIALFAVVILLLALQGGGAETYLLRSKAIWYWQAQPLDNINMQIQKTIAPTVVGGQ